MKSKGGQLLYINDNLQNVQFQYIFSTIPDIIMHTIQGAPEKILQSLK